MNTKGTRTIAAPAQDVPDTVTAAPIKPFAYTVATASELVPLAESSIRRLIREGKIAARYYGSTVLIDAESLERFYRSLPSTRQVDREVAANRYRAA